MVTKITRRQMLHTAAAGAFAVGFGKFGVFRLAVGNDDGARFLSHRHGLRGWHQRHPLETG